MMGNMGYGYGNGVRCIIDLYRFENGNIFAPTTYLLFLFIHKQAQPSFHRASSQSPKNKPNGTSENTKISSVP